VPVVLRIDPLFPRADGVDGSKVAAAYRDAGLPPPQTFDDLEQLVSFAKATGVAHIVYSPVKIVQPRIRPMSPIMRNMRLVYERATAPERLTFRGGSWRLPPAAQSRLTSPLLDLCRRHGVPAKCCKQNLVETM
jgi:hypothetical protein